MNDLINEAIPIFRDLFLHNDHQLYCLQLKDGSYDSQKEKHLTDETVRDILDGLVTVSLKLLHPIMKTAKAIAFDFDMGYEGTTMEEVFSLVKRVKKYLRTFGISARIVFSGNRGFHLWIFFEEYLPFAIIDRFFKETAFGAGFTLRERFPRSDKAHLDGKGQMSIKPPLCIHRKTGVRSGFVDLGLFTDENGKANFVGDLEEQVEIMKSIKKTPTDVIMAFLEKVEIPDDNPALEIDTVPDHADEYPKANLAALPAGGIPNCIKGMMNDGIPLTANLNLALVSVANYCLASGYSEAAYIEVVTQVLRNTSELHPSSKDTFEKRIQNALSVWRTASANPEKYGTFHCSTMVALCGKPPQAGGCQGPSEPCWGSVNAVEPDTIEQPQSSRQMEEAEKEVTSFLLQNPSVAERQIARYGVTSEHFGSSLTSVNAGRTKKTLSLVGILYDVSLLVARIGVTEVNSAMILIHLPAILSEKYFLRIDEGSDQYRKLEGDVLETATDLRKVQPCSEDVFRMLLEFLKKRDLRHKMTKSAEEYLQALDKSTASLPDILSKSIQTQEKLLGTASADQFNNAERLEEFRTDLISKRQQSIPTPSSQFNSLLAGGFQMQALYVLGAVPKSGKTAWIWWVAQEAAKIGIPVLVLSYELSFPELTRNFVSRHTETNSRVLLEKPWINFPSDHKEVLQKIEDAMDFYRKDILRNLEVVECDNTVTVARMKALINQFRNSRGLTKDDKMLVVVDSIHCAGSEDESQQTTQKISGIAKGLKNLAKQTNTAVLAISEISKEALKKAEATGNLGTDCFRDSAAILHAADVLMVMQSSVQADEEPTGKGIKDQPKDTPRDQLAAYFKSRSALEGYGQTKEMKIRTEYPIDPLVAATYVRLSILMNRGGACGDTLYLYKKAIYDFTPVPV